MRGRYRAKHAHWNGALSKGKRQGNRCLAGHYLLAVATECAISVILATRNRASILKDTLASLRAQEVRSRWELIVVDNGCTDNTASVLAQMQEYLPLVSLREPSGGKAGAVNLALRRRSGRLVVFTDDDVRPAPRWLADLERASSQYTAAGGFCGPILPIYPEETPIWMRNSFFAAPAFAQFHPPLPEGYLPPPLMPFGPNFAARDHVLNEVWLDEGVGPGSGLMGGDTALVSDLMKNHRFVYVPSATVGHFVRREQITYPWLFARSFIHGRSMVHSTGRPNPLIPPLRALNLSAEAEAEARYFDFGVRLNYLYGQAYQLSLCGDSRARILEPHIARLRWDGNPDVVAPLALSWLRETPHWVPISVRARFLALCAQQASPI